MQPGLSVETRAKNFIMYGLEYSEHSSFAELKNFVETLKPKKIIPTVNCANKDYRERMKGYFNLWTYGGKSATTSWIPALPARTVWTAFLTNFAPILLESRFNPS